MRGGAGPAGRSVRAPDSGRILSQLSPVWFCSRTQRLRAVHERAFTLPRTAGHFGVNQSHQLASHDQHLDMFWSLMAPLS